MNVQPRFALFASMLCAWAALTQPAFAYIGPGAGVGVIGTVIALIGTFVLLIVGFLWYPVKRLLRSAKSKDGTEEIEADSK